MRRNNINIIGVARRLAACCLLLLAWTGNALAQQTTGQFVIKIDGHYLAHPKVGENWTLQDATTFSPNCLWTSDNTFTQGGTNKNYYFYDDAATPVPRFLAAPQFEAFGGLTLSSSLPPASELNNPAQQYYFYKWDGGLGRGVQYYGVTEDWCTNPDNPEHPGQTHGWNGSECWEVYWVAYLDNVWKLSDEHYDLDDVPTGGKFYAVTVTPHANDTTTLSGGLSDLSGFDMEWNADPLTSHTMSYILEDYQYSVVPAYTTYVFQGGTHNYYGDADHGNDTPDGVNSVENDANACTYSWKLSGDGATYLSFAEGSIVLTSNAATPTVYYRTENNTGHKAATLTLTVTYADGSKQTRTATILVKTPCQNPSTVTVTPNSMGATLSWIHTADAYTVSWTKDSETNWTSVTVNNVTTYTITGLEYETDYKCKVQATCDDTAPTEYTFTTLTDPGLLVTGAIFGGGRMANVVGNTEVVVINCKEIGAIYGGNDIAGSVSGTAGATITLGVDTGDPYDSYGTTSAAIRISDVYGGGNGYYAYNGTSFVAASSDYTSHSVAVGGHVNAMTPAHEVGDVVWTNEGASNVNLTFPSIVKTAITVNNDFVKVDSIFGGAKNAFLTTNSGNGSSITIDGGTILAVFGGNNFGGSQGYGKHYIEVNKTTTHLVANIANTTTTGYGRDFGIRYLFGGGNKVEGSTTDIYINGGQCDTIFAGGNAADIYKANLTVNCTIGDNTNGDGITYNNLYSNAIQTYAGGTITPKTSYDWDGINGIYNVRTLFGGNNKAEMTRVPTLTLTSGSIGTVYGGGNAGDMMGLGTDDGNGGSLTINGNVVVYGTHVVLNSPSMLVDYLYGGCQMSNVANSTWVQLKKGHVGYAYGGCNVSGDVGSTRVNPSAPAVPTSLEDQKVLGATYILAGGANDDNVTIYKDLFAGSNGYYDCSTDGIHYDNDAYYDDPTGQYAGLEIPTHNETNVMVSQGATIKGNVYAGGNLAPVGFDDDTGFDRGYPELVGLASVRMDGGTVEKNVYGGGKMASIFGRNEVMVSGGTIGLALYGGNDIAGKVAEKTNRILPTGVGYTIASDGTTSLDGLGVRTYVGVSGDANIGTVYGGGNGAYTYGGSTGIQYCGAEPNYPIQSYTFVDINIDGGAISSGGGHIGTVYGGGNGVTVWSGVTVFLNVDSPTYDRKHVDTIFGGNNMGDLDVVSHIHLVHGEVGTVYGGCNKGAMAATTSPTDNTVTITSGDQTYSTIGSYVRLLDQYKPNGTGDPVEATAKVTEAVYGGCKMNGVTHNTLVLVEGGEHTGVGIFGGCDISGNVSGESRVVVTGGTVGKAYGGGNGDYNYNSGTYAGLNPPFCNASRIDITGGEATNLFAGGLNGESGATTTLIGGGTVTEKVFGGGDRAGVVIVDTNPDLEITENTTGNSTITMSDGTVLKGIYGGCNATGDIEGNVEMTFTGGTIGATGANNGGSIFGGGYGQPTTVAGNVLINFGEDNNTQSDYPKLIGDLYGGSALGSVNTNSASPNPVVNTTTINIYNGEITGPVTGYANPEDNTYGNVYGGGLGNQTTAATVYGKVYVNIGKTSSPPSGNLSGKATLINCNVFGCNNQNGSPQDEVYVNVYQTAHITGTNTVDDRDFAILQVYGGGNVADYAPEGGNVDSERKTHVYIHGCENTVKFVYGGGNAADAVGVVTLVGGGHFHEIFGGGNGAFGEANIGNGGIGLNVMAGRISFLYAGSNKNGNCTGPNYEATPLPNFIDCGDLIVESFFFGDNEAEHYGDIVHTIECANAEDYHYSKLYGGSRWAIVYGDIKLTVCGGVIEQLFGGSMGYAINQTPAHVRRFPTYAEIAADNAGKYSQALKTYMGYDPENSSTFKTELAGLGGNIELIITGGTIGEAIGGCDELGNVEGKITVIIDDAEDPLCPLKIGDIYGASNLTYYEPWDDNANEIYYNPSGSHAEDAISTPHVVVVKVKTNPTGVEYDFNGNGHIGASEKFEGNVFGGANMGDITSNPIVIVGDGTTGETVTPVTIGGNVYGGGDEGNVKGSPNVVIVPPTHKLEFSNAPTGGTVTVSYPRGVSPAATDAVVTTNAQIGEGIALRVVATPNAATFEGGYVFNQWTVTGTGASVGSKTSASTLFTMGTADATLEASFTHKSAHTLTLESNPNDAGTYTVNGVSYSAPVWLAETASVTIVATPDNEYAFDHWEVTNGSVSNTQSATTTFTMGTTGNATLTAHYKTAYKLTLIADEAGWGTFKVNGADYTAPVWLAEGTIATVVAIPKPAIAEGNGYLFHDWAITPSGTGATLSNTSSASITFKMGTGNVTLTATFTEVYARQLSMVAEPADKGTLKVNGETYTDPVWVAQGASIPISATPAYGYRFKRWERTTGDGTIGDLNAAYTVYIMGSEASTVKAVFEAIATHEFTFASDPAEGGTITVTDDEGTPVTNGTQIREGATLNIVAAPAQGYHFTGWTFTGTGASVGDASAPTTTFTMGTGNASITANFEED